MFQISEPVKIFDQFIFFVSSSKYIAFREFLRIVFYRLINFFRLNAV